MWTCPSLRDAAHAISRTATLACAASDGASAAATTDAAFHGHRRGSLKCTFCRNVTKRNCTNNGTLPCERCIYLGRADECVAFVDGRSLRYAKMSEESSRTPTEAPAPSPPPPVSASPPPTPVHIPAFGPPPKRPIFGPAQPPKVSLLSPDAVMASARVRAAIVFEEARRATQALEAPAPPLPKASAPPPAPVIEPSWIASRPEPVDYVTTRMYVDAGLDPAKILSLSPTFLDIDMADLALRPIPGDELYAQAAAIASFHAAAAAASTHSHNVYERLDMDAPFPPSAFAATQDMWDEVRNTTEVRPVAVSALEEALDAPSATTFSAAIIKMYKWPRNSVPYEFD